MKFILNSIFGLAGLVAAAPAPLENREPKSVFRVSSCTDCYQLGSGFPNCKTNPYESWGKEGDDLTSVCNADPSVFRSECSTDESLVSIQTPFGGGTFEPVKDCDDTAKDGTVQGHVTGLNQKSGHGIFRYECVKNSQQFSDNCGLLEFGCGTLMICTQM